MATKSERVEARLSPGQRERIDRAAAFEGRSVSSFIVAAAEEKAEQVIAAQTTTIVPAAYFDRLLEAHRRGQPSARSRARRIPSPPSTTHPVTYRVEQLSGEHDVAGFDCGTDSLNDWLQRSALLATGQGTRTYLLLDDRTDAVAGYFAIAPHLLQRGEMPKAVGRGAPRQIPAVLFAKLPLARDLQGRGLGADLLIRALETIVEAARVAGGKLIVVDAIDERAARFYEHHDFEALPGNPLRLVAKLGRVAAVLRIPWP